MFTGTEEHLDQNKQCEQRSNGITNTTDEHWPDAAGHRQHIDEHEAHQLADEAWHHHANDDESHRYVELGQRIKRDYPV